MFVLIIDDDKEINLLLNSAFLQAGHKVMAGYNGLEALRCVRENHFDLIVLDIMLPFKSGDEVLREIRLLTDTPVLMLSAKDLTRTKVDLLGLGADDYVTKPFDIDELFARAEAIVRRCSSVRQGAVASRKAIDMRSKYGRHIRTTSAVASRKAIDMRGLSMDMETMEVALRGRTIRLTAKEYQILELLLSYPQKVFTKRNLFESVWGEAYLVEDNTLSVHVSNLRGKLQEICPEEKYIETVWGIGYRLCSQN